MSVYVYWRTQINGELGNKIDTTVHLGQIVDIWDVVNYGKTTTASYCSCETSP